MRTLAALLLAALACPLRAETSIAPGTLVRWPGPGATRCLRDGVAVAPVAGECVFAIDLSHPAGPVTFARERGAGIEKLTAAVGPFPYPVEKVTLDDAYVHVSPKNLARAERERKALVAIFARRTPPRFALPLARPLAPCPEGRNFGRKRILNGEERQPHGGIDYPAATGTPVLAAEDGVVALVARQFFPGNIVVIDHGGGFFTLAMHLDRTLVKPGQVVRRGDRIALSGATGRVNGPHLHFAVRWQDARVDPELLFRPPQELPELR